MASVGSTATIIAKNDTTESRARRLHSEILADIASKGIKKRTTTYGEGYLWAGNINALASKCWPALTVTPGRTGPVTKHFIEVIKKHLADNKNMIWVQARDQYYVSPEYKESRVRRQASVAVKKNVPVSAQESITSRSKRIWERARKACEALNEAVETHRGVEFWTCDKPLSFWIKAEFPELCLPAMETQPNFERYKRPFYDLLRSTTNAVNMGSKYDDSMKDGDHYWLIRKEWHDSHDAFENIFHFEPEPVPEPVPEQVVLPLVVESVEVVVEVEKDQPIDPHLALARLLEVIDAATDTQTENEMLESENLRLQAEIQKLSEENGTLQVTIQAAERGNTVIELVEEVLNNIYEGTIGLGRAIADVEDIIRVAKNDGS